MNIVLAPAARADLDRLEDGACAQVIAELQSFARAPRWQPPGVKQLRGFRPALYRLRSGDYRILFRVCAGALHVYRIIARRDLERTLKRFRA